MRSEYMEISERTAWALGLQDPKERLEELSILDFLFELTYHDPTQQKSKAANLLVAAALKEPVIEIRKEMYKALESATVWNDLSTSLNWDNLLAGLPHADYDMLLSILSCLGQSARKDIIPILDRYCTHPHLPLQVTALVSLGEIWYTLSHQDPFVKKLIIIPLYYELTQFPPQSPFSEEESRAKSAQYHEILMREMALYFEGHPEV